MIPFNLFTAFSQIFLSLHNSFSVWLRLKKHAKVALWWNSRNSRVKSDGFRDIQYRVICSRTLKRRSMYSISCNRPWGKINFLIVVTFLIHFYNLFQNIYILSTIFSRFSENYLKYFALVFCNSHDTAFSV